MATINLSEAATTGDILIFRIRGLSGLLRIGLWVLVGLFLAIAAVVVVADLFGASVSWHETAYDFSGATVDFQLLAGWRQVPFAVLACVPTFLGLAVVWQLERLLASYQQGAILTVRNAVRIRRVGQLLIGWFVAEPCINGVAWLLLGMLGLGAVRSGPAMVVNFAWLFAGLIVLIVGHAMRAASMVAEEAALTV